MIKKNIQKQNFASRGQKEDHQNILENIHQKLDNSPALNGGFDRLLYKIDGIEKSQVQIVEKVDKIHDAIYHPDDGLFARIAMTKTSNLESVSKIEKQVFEISAWKQRRDSEDEDLEKDTDEIQVKIQKIENSIENMEKFQGLIFSLGKWVAVAVGGAVISFVAEALYKVVH